MPIQVGDRFPALTLTRVGADGNSQLSSAEAFAGKRVVLIGVPGAFTPTCTVNHLPGYVDGLDRFTAAGIDAVAVTAVNDPFVVKAWATQAGADLSRMMFLADGNGELARALDLELDASGFGMGKRSQRYAMVVNDGVIEHLFVEEPGKFEVSGADHLLAKLKG